MAAWLSDCQRAGPCGHISACVLLQKLLIIANHDLVTLVSHAGIINKLGPWLPAEYPISIHNHVVQWSASVVMGWGASAPLHRCQVLRRLIRSDSWSWGGSTGCRCSQLAGDWCWVGSVTHWQQCRLAAAQRQEAHSAVSDLSATSASCRRTGWCLVKDRLHAQSCF